MKILEVNHGSIAYDHEQHFAVEDVSFSVEEGEYLCIVGSNGSGKSTLIKGVVGLVPLSAGSIIHSYGPESYAYLAQINTIEKEFPATVAEVVLSGTQNKGKGLPFYTKEDKQVAEQAMETLNITALKDKRIGNLSGGQQQRVMLARAICRNPKMLILDEPCTGLDPVITREFYQLLGAYNKQGMTIVMVSHDADQVENYANRVIVMNQTIEFDGPAEVWAQNWRPKGGLCHHE